jgi:DNA adenine methylase
MSYLLGYYGGKIGPVGAWIAAQLPPHKIYVEAFGGMAGVLMQKRPAPVEVYNDRAQELDNLMRVVREQPKELRLALELTQYGRQEYKRCIATRHEPGISEVERARRTYVIVAMGRDGSLNGKGFSFGGAAYKGSVADTFKNGQERIPWVSQRLRGVLLECGSWQTVCRQHDGPDTLFYLDPPYVLSTRTGNYGYVYEMSDTEHEELLDWCLRARGKILLSGYDSALYAPLLAAGWVCRRLPVVAHSSAARQKKGTRAERVECLWLNPQAAAYTLTLFCAQHAAVAL